MNKSSSKEKFGNYRKKLIISSSNKMKPSLNASKKKDYLCWFLRKSNKHLKNCNIVKPEIKNKFVVLFQI